VFDIDVRTEKRDPYSRISYNQTLKDLYAMGVFHPENAEAARVLLSAMDFNGVERVRRQIAANAAKGKEAVHVTAAPANEDPLLCAYRDAERLRAAAEERA
jgi:hypothetical protein